MHSTQQLLWYRAVHLTIARSVRKKIKQIEKKEEADRDELELDHLRWRLAYNLYSGGSYKSAMEMFTKLTADPDENDPLFKKRKLHKDSKVHHMAGRCATELFFSSNDHTHLEAAHEHYQKAVETMEVNLFTMFTLPSLLLEFGRVMEHYGAFEAANEIYARILSGFPNFRGYFDALYRTAIVGRYLATLIEEPTAKEDMLKKSIDIFQFLLEALPSNISDVQILMLYGRTLELSSSPQVKFRAHAIYRTLFELCQKQFIAGATKSTEPADWLNNADTWLRLADEFADARESLIAKDGYDKFLELKTKFTPYGKHVTSELSVETCVKLAKSAAQYQNFTEAVRFAEMGLKVHRYDTNVRSLLSNWSKPHVKQFEKEERARRKILSVWKNRCWTTGFRIKLKQLTIARLEEQYRKNRWDFEAREGLAYYAKDRYRHKFVFEECCAVRVQRFFRHRKKLWIWTQAQRQHYYTKASEVMRRYQRFPYNTEVRRELLEIAAHRLAPLKHPIQTAKEHIVTEHLAVVGIERCMACYKIRKEVTRLVIATRERQALRRFMAARTIQCCVRMFISIRRLSLKYEDKRKVYAAATCIQQFIRHRIHSLYHLVGKVVDRNASRMQRAFNVLRRRLPQAVKNYFLRKEAQVIVAELKAQREERIRLAAEELERRNKASKTIQRFWVNVTNAFWSKVSTEVIKQRKLARFSFAGTERLTQLHTQQQQFLQQEQQQKYYNSKRKKGKPVAKSSTAMNPVCYHVPGINQQSEQFLSLAKQEVIVCSGEFSAADCMMLSRVLRHLACSVRVLVLEEIVTSADTSASFEFDVIAALIKCRSVRAVHVYGGEWTAGFLSALVQLVQVDNPRVVSISIEKIHMPGMFCDALAYNAGRLLCDYFNYTAPGLQELTLHGCALRDSQVELIGKGLAVNSSIRSVCLSLNLLNDSGFIEVFGAVCRNPKSKVEKIDCNWNLIQCHTEMRNMLRQYKAHSLSIFMELHLLYNRIFDCYHPVQDLNRHGEAEVLRIFYSKEDLEAARTMTVRHQKQDAGHDDEQSVGSQNGGYLSKYRHNNGRAAGPGHRDPNANPLADPALKSNFTAKLRKLQGTQSVPVSEMLSALNDRKRRANKGFVPVGAPDSSDTAGRDFYSTTSSNRSMPKLRFSQSAHY